METQAPDFKDYLRIINRRRKFVVIPFIIIFLLSIVLAVTLPSVYRSTATILIEEQEIPNELVRSTVTTFADQRIQIISQRIMSRSNLMEIIKKYNLYTDELKSKTEEKVLDTMRKSIKVETISADVIDPRNGVPTKATIAFTLNFDNNSPVLCQKVANELVSLFLKENIKARTESADNTALFLGEESRRLKEKIQELQAKLAGFKEKNLEQLPESHQLNQSELTTVTNQLLGLENQVRSIKERRLFIESQLAQVDPNTSATNAVGNRIFDMKDRLKQLQAEYPSLVSRYSEQHPDVNRYKREIESLQKELGVGSDVKALNAELTEKKSTLAGILKQYSDKHPDVQRLEKEIDALQQALNVAKENNYASVEVPPDNPAYISLQTQLDAADNEMRSLEVTRGQLTQRMNELRDHLRQTPLVEKEYMDMLQELDNTNLRYREVGARQMEAEIGQQLEIQKKGERFTLIDPPQEPLQPHSPNRLVILFLGFVVAIAGGFGAVALVELLDASIHSERSIALITGKAPLAVIPYLESKAESEARKRRIILLLAGGAGATLVVLTAFHFLFMPLDVFWYKLLRVFSNL